MAADNRTARRSAPPTIKTLADITGYSIATISKALRGSPVVAAATRETIFRAAREVGYQANARGMALRTGRTRQAAVLMPVTAAQNYEWDGVEYTQILSGISQALEGSDYRMSVHVVRDAADGCDVARRVIDQGLADGLIFSGILVDDPRIDFLVERGFPFVSLGRCRKTLDYASVDIDNEWAAHAATARLIAGGHRRIALVNPERRLSYALDRIDGFARAFCEAGLRASSDLVVEGDLSTHFGRESAVRLLQAAEPPTAFVCINESTTLGVLSALGSLRRQVGADIDVIAYDDINVSVYFTPPITTFYQPIEVLGRTLGEFLLRRMAGEEPNALRQVFRPTLIERQPDNLGGRLVG
ncbi:LacI family DNA-binding transcriptional regulator [Sinorhizobium terangae]|uniref:LacI family DNA-binding transcriptional regulator n=1 Tax=Sinorhizobium terangae TaxID=110322 RepID=UPI0024B0D0EB|nr:LacI family DNA-binding transcriptional regulator [Sinorhizobium terangae]WFU50587.1 LacI family DNA-binding transcriptional regulator [Sinorhizobium terangae]